MLCCCGLTLHAESTKQERNLIADGNKLYKEKRFAEAEVKFRKALEANAASETAAFNLAASLIRQGGNPSADSEDKTMKEARQLLSALSQGAKDARLAELAAYNLGNLDYNAQQYQQSIEMYKNALRRNPDNDKARQNLRLAQKKLQEQQNQDKNQDKDQNKDQDKDQKDKDQDKDQNNKDQDQKDQDQNQQNQQNQQQQQQQNQQQQQQQQQGGISDSNAEKILKAMENEEKATRARINAKKGKENNATRRQVAKPW